MRPIRPFIRLSSITKSNIQFGRQSGRIPPLGAMPAKAVPKRNVWPTLPPSGPICDRSVYVKKWRKPLAILEQEWSTPPTNLALTEGEIHIWRAGLDRPAAQVAHLTQTLAPDEQLRAERFHFERDRQRFIVGRGVLRAILGRYLHLAPAQLQFCYGARGKPALAESLAGGKGQLHFNLAHSGNLAVYALVRGQEIGVDVEQIHPIVEMVQIAERFFATQERAALLALPPEQRQPAFFNCWTRKEAYLKALGDGLTQPLDQFIVSLGPGEPARLLSLAGDVIEASRWLIEAFHPADGYVAAVAIPGQGWHFNYWDWLDPGA